MKEIDISELDFQKLKKLRFITSSESNIYYDKDFLYKIYKNNGFFWKVPHKEEKLLILNESPLQNVIIPDTLIKKSNHLEGCKMTYIPKTKPFEKYKFQKSPNDFFERLLSVSKTIETIHKDPREIIIGDLGFYNILYNEDNIYLCDIDSARIDKYDADRITKNLKEYYDYKNDYLGLVTKESDKLSLFLETFKLIFGKKVEKIDMKQYDKLSEKINTLKNMREIIVLLKESYYVPEVPYIHELILSKDIKSQI